MIKTKQLSEMTLEELWQLFPIILSEHNSDWTNYYNEEKALLEKQFGSLLVRINHIGSTAVEGLIAKPTVDILLVSFPFFSNRYSPQQPFSLDAPASSPVS